MCFVSDNHSQPDSIGALESASGDNQAHHFTNTGDSDVSPDGLPSQFLLFRGLEPTVTTQLLSKGATKLYKSTGGSPAPQAPSKHKPGAKVSSTTAEANLGAKEGSLRRVLLVKDRWTDESWRYGFAEFASIEVRGSPRTVFLSLTRHSGLSSCFSKVQRVGEVHDIIQACSVEFHSHRGVRAGFESRAGYGKLHFQPTRKSHSEACLLG